MGRGISLTLHCFGLRAADAQPRTFPTHAQLRICAPVRRDLWQHGTHFTAAQQACSHSKFVGLRGGGVSRYSAIYPANGGYLAYPLDHFCSGLLAETTYVLIITLRYLSKISWLFKVAIPTVTTPISCEFVYPIKLKGALEVNKSESL